LGELDDLMADLPGVDLEQLSGASLERVAGGPPLPGRRFNGAVEARQGRFSLAWRAAWGSWLPISLLFLAVWLVTGASGSLWFLWVVLPLSTLLLGRWLMGASTRS
jgi:hypothetical protein